MLVTRLRATGMPIRKIRRYAELVRDGEGNEAERLEILESHRGRGRGKDRRARAQPRADRLQARALPGQGQLREARGLNRKLATRFRRTASGNPMATSSCRRRVSRRVRSVRSHAGQVAALRATSEIDSCPRQSIRSGRMPEREHGVTPGPASNRSSPGTVKKRVRAASRRVSCVVALAADEQDVGSVSGLSRPPTEESRSSPPAPSSDHGEWWPTTMSASGTVSLSVEVDLLAVPARSRRLGDDQRRRVRRCASSRPRRSPCLGAPRARSPSRHRPRR